MRSKAFHTLFQQRRLVIEMSKRELTDRYVGQALGWSWSIIHPLILMGLYVFVFTVIFKQNMGGTRDFPLDYTAYVLTGLTCWLNIQDALTRGATSVTSKSELVKQVVFPTEILPVKAVLSSGLSMSVTLLILLAYTTVQFGFHIAPFILGPVIVLAQLLFLTGSAFFFSSLSVFVRDTKEFVQVFCFAGVYLIPAFYLPSWIPGLFKPILYLNPFSHFVWCFHDAFFYRRIEHPISWLIVLVLALSTFLIGHRVFMRLSSAFGNFL